MAGDFKIIEKEYESIKRNFQEREGKEVSYEIALGLGETSNSFKKVFSFLVDSFDGELRRDNKTPLVFHSIYLTKLLYNCGVYDEEALLIGALHDVLEDTRVSKSELMGQDFMKDKGEILDKLDILTENKNLSRKPDGKTLPPRYVEHISRMIGAPVEVINVELVDRFSDLMDLEYIIELPEAERKLRLESKMIKVKSFVKNITRARNDYNSNCLDLFNYKARQIEERYGLDVEGEAIFSKG